MHPAAGQYVQRFYNSRTDRNQLPVFWTDKKAYAVQQTVWALNQTHKQNDCNKICGF
jgi:hypothetical protein